HLAHAIARRTSCPVARRPLDRAAGDRQYQRSRVSQSARAGHEPSARHHLVGHGSESAGATNARTARQPRVCDSLRRRRSSIVGARGVKTRWRPLLGMVIPPLALLTALVVLWQAAVVAFELPNYYLPRPGRVWLAAQEHASELTRATGLTAAAALAGFVLSLAVGFVIALAFSQS